MTPVVVLDDAAHAMAEVQCTLQAAGTDRVAEDALGVVLGQVEPHRVAGVGMQPVQMHPVDHACGDPVQELDRAAPNPLAEDLLGDPQLGEDLQGGRKEDARLRFGGQPSVVLEDHERHAEVGQVQPRAQSHRAGTPR
ncbi:MAG: hypothetical protein QOC67_3770 [Pseudonocardiales bacterium]|nr:hypothetical protein [Pseudonocardiales bacterium]